MGFDIIGLDGVLIQYRDDTTGLMYRLMLRME